MLAAESHGVEVPDRVEHHAPMPPVSISRRLLGLPLCLLLFVSACGNTSHSNPQDGADAGVTIKGEGEPCGEFDFCYTTINGEADASIAENPEVTLRIQVKGGAPDGKQDLLLFLDVPTGSDPGELPLGFPGGEDSAVASLRFVDERGEGPTFWSKSGRLILKANGERLTGELHDVVLDESLRDPEDGSRRAYLKTLSFDAEIINTGD